MTRPGPGWRRLAAGGVDYGIVAAYLALLGLVGALGRATGLLPTSITTPGGRILGQLVAVVVLTLPVTLWFAWWEIAPRGATPGKRLLGLRVSRLDGGGLSWSDSLLRSAVKIAVPWELAHTGVWNALVWPGPQAPVNVVLFTVANGLLVLNLVTLFLGGKRTPYDRLAGTIVVAEVPPHGLDPPGSASRSEDGGEDAEDQHERRLRRLGRGTMMIMITAAMHRFRCPPARHGLAGALGMA